MKQELTELWKEIDQKKKKKKDKRHFVNENLHYKSTQGKTDTTKSSVRDTENGKERAKKITLK